MQGSVGTIGKGFGQIGAGVGRLAGSLLKLGAVGASAIGGALVYNLKAGIDALLELELQNAATVAGLKSTDGASGQTAESIRALSEEYENLNATIDDKVIQSAQNLLLTFPKIGKDAFEPALEAALNLNQALGGGESGLQDSIIRIGKALQDPIRGVTALRRVGVAFTEAQEKQIKTLVDQNDLLGAQKIILQELAVEFGGRFAAAGDTAAGRIAKLHDNVEELQKTMAGPFAGEGGVIDRVVGKLGDFLGEAGTQQAVKNLGEALAGLFDDRALDKGVDALRRGLDLLSPGNLRKVGEAAGKAVDFIKGIDFATIGRALEVAGRVAKTTIDAFLSLPPAVQAVVIGGLAANKLSGGLLGAGLGNVAKGAGSLVTGGGLLGRGSTPANPLFVSMVGGLPGAGGAPVAGGTSLLGTAAAVGSGLLVGGAIAAPMLEKTAGPARKYEEEQFTKALDRSKSLKDIDQAIASLEAQQKDIGSNQIDTIAAGASEFAGFFTGGKGVLTTLSDQLGILRAQRADFVARMGPLAIYANMTSTGVARLAEQQAGDRAERSAAAARQLELLRQQVGGINQIAAKPPASIVTNITTNIRATLSVKQALATMSVINSIRSDFAAGDSTGGSM